MISHQLSSGSFAAMQTNPEGTGAAEPSSIAYPDELGSAAFGFLDLPSLFIFFDPFSPYENVRRALVAAPFSWEAVKKVAAGLDKEARSDLRLALVERASQTGRLGGPLLWARICVCEQQIDFARPASGGAFQRS